MPGLVVQERGYKSNFFPPADRKKSLFWIFISSSVSRQSAAKPGQITCTWPIPLLPHFPQQFIGVGLQPCAGAEAGLKGDFPETIFQFQLSGHKTRGCMAFIRIRYPRQEHNPRVNREMKTAVYPLCRIAPTGRGYFPPGHRCSRGHRGSL